MQFCFFFFFLVRLARGPGFSVSSFGYAFASGSRLVRVATEVLGTLFEKLEGSKRFQH